MFRGSIVALVTPFKGTGIDEKAIQELVEWHIQSGTEAIVPCGTTGESPTLSMSEHKRVVEICVQAAAGRVPIIAGSGSNNTREAIELTSHAKEVGANAVLVVTPYYNKPSQQGLFEHFKTLAEAVDIPIIIYNIPPRSVVDMSVETMARLAELPNIIGVKDATQDLARPLKTLLAIGPKFCQLSGEDATVVPFLSQGGVGCISVSANVVPKSLAQLHTAWVNRDLDAVFSMNKHLLPLHEAMFCEPSPGPVKYALELLGKCSAKTRLPLAEISEGAKARVHKALTELGLI